MSRALPDTNGGIVANSPGTGAYGAIGPRTAVYTNKKLAVRKDWNDMTEQTRFRIKKESVIIEGKTAPKIDVDGTPLPGGGHQILNLDLDNLIKSEL